MGVTLPLAATPELDLDLLDANFKRLVDCFKLVVRLIDYLDYVCLWAGTCS